MGNVRFGYAAGGPRAANSAGVSQDSLVRVGRIWVRAPSLYSGR
jgi:hypothetical protein